MFGTDDNDNISGCFVPEFNFQTPKWIYYTKDNDEFTPSEFHTADTNKDVVFKIHRVGINLMIVMTSYSENAAVYYFGGNGKRVKGED